MGHFDPLQTLTELMKRGGTSKPSKVFLKDGTSFLGIPIGIRSGTHCPDSATFEVHASATVLTVLLRHIRSIS